MSSSLPQQGYAQSLTLHLSIVGLVAVLTWFKPFARKHEPIFEVIQIPLGVEGGAQDVSQPSASFDLPPAPAPTPRPQPVTPPLPPPQQQTRPPPPAPVVRQLPPPVVPRETVAPQPAKPPPTPPQKQISYEDFIRENGVPTTRAPRPSRPTTPRPAPRIDTRFNVDLTTAIRSAGSLSGTAGVMPSAVNIYVAGLNDLLKQAWNNPQLALTTVVDFDVAPSGKISNVRITQRSGNAAFDESVLAAFRQVTSGGPTPEGRSLELRFKFNGIAP